MILSDSSILKEMKDGNIVISPFTYANLNPCSIDLTIADKLKMYDNDTLDVMHKQSVSEFKIQPIGNVLFPGNVYLCHCNETIAIKGNLRGRVEGKSSLGRLGLFIHVTAGFIDPGFEGSLVLELVATQPIKIYAGMKICQIEFARVEGDIIESYGMKEGSKYQNQQGTQESKYHLNFK